MIGKFGLLEPLVHPLLDPKVLKFSLQHLATSELHHAPAAKNFADGVPKDSDPLGNYDWGDCTLASIGHKITNALALLGKQSPVTADEIVRIYLKLTGGQDNGLRFLQALEYAATEGICGVKIIYAAVDYRDRQLMSNASGLFGGLLVGAALPKEIEGQDVWDRVPGMVPGSLGRHAIFRPGHSPLLGNYNSWGEDHDATDAWEEECIDELYVVQVVGAPTPCGLNIEALMSDFNRITLA